jgi:adenylate cyclase
VSSDTVVDRLAESFRKMIEHLRFQRLPLAAGAVTVAALLAAELATPRGWREGLREFAFDLVLAADQWLRPMAGHGKDSRVVVVDIDRRSLEAIGSWPWPRATMAGLVDAIAAAKPGVVAIDILFAEHDLRCSPVRARRSGPPAGPCEKTARAAELIEGDELLAQAGRQVPLVLGFLLDPEGSNPSRPRVPVVTRGSPSLDELWSVSGAALPAALLIESAAGIGALSLPANSDGVVRYVPLLVGVGGYLRPGLALETMRVSASASAYLLQSAPPILATGDLEIPFTSDGLLRLTPAAPERRAARTISALDVLDEKVDLAGIAGAIVLIGGSAPELGGLRKTATDPLTPPVQIQADAIEQIASGRFPRPIGGATGTQLLLVVVLGALALAASAMLSPILAALAVIAAVLLTWATAIAMSVLTDRLVDPLAPSFAAAAVFVIVSVTSFAGTRRREAMVRRRFEQHLAPAVVRRIIEQPGLLKLSGEYREVTALFTDVEGFTAITHRASPEELVATLDDYFEGIAAMIVEHGGMVDKIVGDAVHALFNAPLDLDDHPRRAVECAIAIQSWTETHRALPGPAAIGFGRTRIGIETGQAIVGDVGLRSKLDYTAHGDAVNAASRFEAENKRFGSAICVGPGTAARCDPGMFRPLGTILVRGRDEPLTVFEPWPSDAPAGWRERYLAAFGLMARDPQLAAASFEQLAIERKNDPVAHGMAERLRAGAAPSYA